MIFDKVNNPLYQADDLIHVAYEHDLDIWKKIPVYCDQNIEKYQLHQNMFGLPVLNITEADDDIQQADLNNQNKWYYPESYDNLDILDYCIRLCKTDEEINRVKIEYSLYQKHDMIHVIKYIIYLIDIMKTNKIIWGVGRGSSVSSFILYLIGLHKINPIKHELDYIEFFKNNGE